MRVLFIKFSRLTLLALLAASCSIQQRTVLPGFHVFCIGPALVVLAVKPFLAPFGEQQFLVGVRLLNQLEVVVLRRPACPRLVPVEACPQAYDAATESSKMVLALCVIRSRLWSHTTMFLSP